MSLCAAGRAGCGAARGAHGARGRAGARGATLHPNSKPCKCVLQDALDAELRAELEARAGELARAAPNLKAVDQFEAVRVRLP